MTYVKHGMWNTAEYRAWSSIKTRCFNTKSENYSNYGGRGITICPEWRSSFEAFYAHIGPRPSAGHSVDRIDVNGDYEPGNVRWATSKEQALNRRVATICRNGLHELTPDNICIESNGRRRCLACRRIKNARKNKGVPDPQPCGTSGAYQRHRLNGEKPCDACRQADNANRRARRARKQAAA